MERCRETIKTIFKHIFTNYSMIKKIVIFILAIIPIDILGQGIDCFTHPLCGFPITLYSSPSAFACLKDLSIPTSGEAGYEVVALRKENSFILLSFPYGENEQAWVKIGDVGVVIQNYSNYSIPIYTQPDSSSTVQTNLLTGYIAILYDWTEDFVRVCVKDEESECIGWIDRQYICGSPYTTCN